MVSGKAMAFVTLVRTDRVNKRDTSKLPCPRPRLGRGEATGFQIECSRSGTERLLLRGSWAAASIAVTLKRLDETKLPLIRSKRRWINGFP